MNEVVCVEFSGGATDKIHKAKFDRGCLYGGAVVASLPWLDELATHASLPPLSAFLHPDSPDRWHPAADGYRTASFLLQKVRERADGGGADDQHRLKDIIWDLSVITTLLQGGSDEGADFRLAFGT